MRMRWTDTVGISHTVTGYGSAAADEVTVTVADTGTAGVTIAPASLTVIEGGSIPYTVALDTDAGRRRYHHAGCHPVRPRPDADAGRADLHHGDLEHWADGDRRRRRRFGRPHRHRHHRPMR